METARINVDLNTLTLEEAETVEHFGGQSIAELGAGKMNARSLAALVFVVRSREDSSFTFDDARKLKIAQLDLAVSELDPTGAAG